MQEQKKFLVASLVGDRPVSLWAHCMLETIIRFGQQNIQAEVTSGVGHSDLAYGRNRIMANFLRSDFTDLIWIDDDMVWKAEDVMKIAFSEKDVVGCNYSKKSGMPEDDVRRHTLTLLPESNWDGDLLEVKNLGFGLIKISRNAMETIIEKRPEVLRSPDHVCAKIDKIERFPVFCHFDGCGYGEDWQFCQLWRSVGGQVWLDTTIDLGHVGDYEYRASMENILPARPIIEEAA